MRFDVKFNLLKNRIPVIFDEIREINIKEEPDYYQGSYEVTPTVKGETLATAKKTMLMDLIINKIPYAEVTNTANGLTVTIAE